MASEGGKGGERQLPPESFWGYFEYADLLSSNGGDTSRVGFAGAGDEEGKELLLELAGEGVGNLDQGITPEALNYAPVGSEMEEEYINTVFSYEMKNGRKVTRIYCLERGGCVGRPGDALRR